MKMVGMSESSSSDDEALQRCREAVWETGRDGKTGGGVCVVLAERDEADMSVQEDKLQ